MTASLGEFIRERRLQAGLSRTELARKIGVHRTYVAQMEKPSFNPRLKLFWKIYKELIPDLHFVQIDKPCQEHDGRCEPLPPVIRVKRDADREKQG